jgi:uncharacterized membrane protein YraQ (UPF0718 family)
MIMGLLEQTGINAFHFSISVLSIFPPVLLFLKLLEAWLPANTVEAYLGKKSGIKGMFLAILLGSLAAGPLFAAFPIASTFSKKGGRAANTVIFLGSWASIKVPMLLMESHFLGLRFSLLRLAVTVPFVILMGIVMERLFTHKKVGQ